MKQYPDNARITVVLCLAEIVGMLSFSVFPALLPGFIDRWALTNTEAGWINGIYFAGYLVVVAALTSLTDRVPPGKVYRLAALLTAFSSLGFALLADGFWSAMVLRLVAGVGLAGTYMPGLKLLTDHVTGPRQSRAIAFYTSSFSIGSALSFFYAGEVNHWLGWQGAFAVATLGPVAAIVLLHYAIPREEPVRENAPDTHLLDFRPVFKTRAAMGFVLAYACHSFELFALRAWLVAYLVFAERESGVAAVLSATVTAALVNLLGLPASVLGNEAAEHFGRRRVLGVIMLCSGLVAVVFGWAGGQPMTAVIALAFVYGVLVTGDSAALTAGLVKAAPRGYRGATMAVHSTIGFMGAFAGPLVFGIVLDSAGGGEKPAAWALAFAAIGAVVALGPVALWLLGSGAKEKPPEPVVGSGG